MSLKKAHQGKWLVFLDTGVFLHAYEGVRRSILDNLRDLAKHANHIITTFLVADEFKRNRHRVMNRWADELSKSQARITIRDFAKEWPESDAAVKAEEAARLGTKALLDRLRQAIEFPTKNDPAWDPINELLDAKRAYVLSRDGANVQSLMERAARRQQLGNPPLKAGGTLGDALNWEWCLEVCKGQKANLLVVTLDGDYGAEKRGEDWLPNMLLLEEFRRVVGKDALLEVTSRTSLALEVLGQTVSAARKVDEEKALQERQAAQQLFEQVASNLVRLNAAQHSSVNIPGQDLARFLADSFGMQLNIPAPVPSPDALDAFKAGPAKQNKDASSDKT